MNRSIRIDSPKKATNLSLNADLVEDAKRLGINVSQACEAGLNEEVRKTKQQKWLQENREAIDWSNRYVEEHGLPLAKYRLF